MFLQCVINLAERDSSSLESQSDLTSPLKLGLDSQSPFEDETPETTPSEEKGHEVSEEDKSEDDDDMSVMFSTQHDADTDGPK